jgi:hypothetical protein
MAYVGLVGGRTPHVAIYIIRGLCPSFTGPHIENKRSKGAGETKTLGLFQWTY